MRTKRPPLLVCMLPRVVGSAARSHPSLPPSLPPRLVVSHVSCRGVCTGSSIVLSPLWCDKCGEPMHRMQPVSAVVFTLACCSTCLYGGFTSFLTLSCFPVLPQIPHSECELEGAAYSLAARSIPGHCRCRCPLPRARCTHGQQHGHWVRSAAQAQCWRPQVRAPTASSTHTRPEELHLCARAVHVCRRAWTSTARVPSPPSLVGCELSTARRFRVGAPCAQHVCAPHSHSHSGAPHDAQRCKLAGTPCHTATGTGFAWDW